MLWEYSLKIFNSKAILFIWYVQKNPQGAKEKADVVATNFKFVLTEKTTWICNVFLALHKKKRYDDSRSTLVLSVTFIQF